MTSGAARYSRQTILPGFGQAGQDALSRARVLVVGAGGLGSTVIPTLAAAGVGTLAIIDGDVVDESNLARQSIYAPNDIGESKAIAATLAASRLNPSITVEALPELLTTENALEHFANYDLVLDCSDNFSTRYLVHDAAALSDIPVVWGAMHQYDGQVGVSWASQGPSYRDLFAQPPAADSVEPCSVAGVLPSLCAVIGGLMANEALKLLTGVGVPLIGQVTVFDALRGSFRHISFERDPEAEPVTELIDYDAWCGVAGPAASEPATAEVSITAPQLAELLASGEKVTLIDVREPWEAEIVKLDGDLLMPLRQIQLDPTLVPDEGVTVFYCHYGPRSDHAQAVVGRGLSLEGGIDAWSRLVDPGARRY